MYLNPIQRIFELASLKANIFIFNTWSSEDRLFTHIITDILQNDNLAWLNQYKN